MSYRKACVETASMQSVANVPRRRDERIVAEESAKKKMIMMDEWHRSIVIQRLDTKRAATRHFQFNRIH